jgi:hypothetical protein
LLGDVRFERTTFRGEAAFHYSLTSADILACSTNSVTSILGPQNMKDDKRAREMTKSYTNVEQKN